MAEIVDGPNGPHKIEIKREDFEESIDTYIEKIIDFHSEKVFQAQTYTAITFLNKNIN